MPSENTRKLTDQRKAYIYALKCTEGKPFYIGSTIAHVKDRFAGHKSSVKNKRHHNQHLQNKWLKIGLDNVICETIETTSEGKRYDREYYWIQKHIKDGSKLTNIILDRQAHDRFQQTKWNASIEGLEAFILVYGKIGPDDDLVRTRQNDAFKLAIIQKLWHGMRDDFIERIGVKMFVHLEVIADMFGHPDVQHTMKNPPKPITMQETAATISIIRASGINGI